MSSTSRSRKANPPAPLFDEPLPRCKACEQPLRGEEFEGDLHVLLHNIEIALAPDTEPDQRKASLKVVKRLVNEIRVEHEVWTPGPYVQ